MKLKTAFHLLGLRPKPQVFGYEIVESHLPDDGLVQYAQWLHPKETRKSIRQEHVDAMRAYLSEGDVALDIGAHTGDSTIPLALAAGKSGRVLAFEPNPYVFKILSKNASLNADKTSIETHCLASTATDGPIEFEYSDSGYCNGGRHEGISVWVHGHAFRLRVQGINLENFLRREKAELLPRLKFIKVDAEGYDATILQSIQGLLAEFHPVIKCEFFKLLSEEQRQRQWSVLDSLGYDVFHITNQNDSRGERITRDTLMLRKHFDAICVPHTAAAQPGRRHFSPAATMAELT